MNCSFAVLGLPLWVAVVAVAGAVAFYLFLRVNPRKKAKLDAAVDKVKDKLSK